MTATFHKPRGLETRAEQRRRWKAMNPERVKEINNASYHRNKNRRAEKVQAYRETEDYQLGHRRRESSRRAQKRGQFIEDVDPTVVYEMHGGRCGICGEFIEGDFHVDHVMPLSKGGMHCYANVQPAHPFCNLSKKDKVI